MDSTTTTNRVGYYDFLKFLGLSGIIFAHVESPGLVMMLRSFDVPLMVMVSAMLSQRSYSKIKANHHSAALYCISRFKRLVFPTWIFLTFYFALYYVLSGEAHDIKYYLASYALTRYGIGYVWVILIYLYCAILVPAFDKIGFSAKSIALVAIAYLSHEAGYFFGIGTQNKIILSTIYYIIPYGTLAFIGFNYKNLSSKAKQLIMYSAFLICMALGIYYWIRIGSPQRFSIVKYPPRLYYLTYGVFCSFAMLMFSEKHPLKIFESAIIKFISVHSMWIYLWHILVLTIYDWLCNRFSFLPSSWYIKFFMVYTGSIIITVVANKVLDTIEKIHRFTIIKYLRG